MAFKQVFVPLNHVLSLLDSEARRLMESGKHMILVQYTEKKDGILIAKYGRKGDSFDSSDMKYAEIGRAHV